MDYHLWFNKTGFKRPLFLFLLFFSTIFVHSLESLTNGIYLIQDKYLLKTNEICPHIIGYADHISLEITTSKNLIIEDVEIINHSETPSYIRFIQQKHSFLERFKGINILETDQSVDAITGATFTTKAIKEEIAFSGRALDSYLQNIEMEKVSSFNLKIYLFSFFGIGLNILYLFYFRKKELYLPICIFNIIIIFYVFGLQLSIANIIGAFNGFINTFSLTNLFILTLFVIFTGRYYCSHMCPFGLLAEFLGYKGMQIKISKRLNIFFKITGFLYLTCLIYSYYYKFYNIQYDMEVLNYFFRFNTDDVFFIIGVVFLFSSLFINRFFCRYICPTGMLLSITRFFSPQKVKKIDYCVSCKRCKEVCPTGAIYSDEKGKIKIDSLNCIDCYRCTNICNLQNKKTNSK